MNIKEVISFVAENIRLWIILLCLGGLILIEVLNIIDFIKVYIKKRKKK